MNNRYNNIIDEYHFLKKRLKKLERRATQMKIIPLKRLAQKMASLFTRIQEIEKECKERGLPHPDAYKGEGKDYISRLLADHPIKSVMKSICNPDGTLYTKDSLAGVKSTIDRQSVRLTPDGRLFETPALEGSFQPRRSET